MNYRNTTTLKDDDRLRESFNELTRKTFGFDFVNWYEAGHWGGLYIPHAMLDGEKVISNVSVNFMQFDMGGEKKSYIQLGTVMTDEEYRGQGLNKSIMEWIFSLYGKEIDGIYLFAGDDVLNYYPKYGFKPIKEYEYYLSVGANAKKLHGKEDMQTQIEEAATYTFQKIDMQDAAQAEDLYRFLEEYEISASEKNQNDGMYMNQNVNLYQFWFGAGYSDKVYYIKEADAYVVMELEADKLMVYQVFGKQEVDMQILAQSLKAQIKEVVLGFTPAQKEKYLVREHKEEDCTLFIWGKDLEQIEKKQMMFPLLSHA